MTTAGRRRSIIEGGKYDPPLRSSPRQNYGINTRTRDRRPPPASIHGGGPGEGRVNDRDSRTTQRRRLVLDENDEGGVGSVTGDDDIAFAGENDGEAVAADAGVDSTVGVW